MRSRRSLVGAALVEEAEEATEATAVGEERQSTPEIAMTQPVPDPVKGNPVPKDTPVPKIK